MIDSLRQQGFALAGTALLIGFGLAAHAEPAAGPRDPQVITRGRAEVLIPATRASFTVGIRTFAQTASVAGADNARLSKIVADALQSAGLQTKELASSRLVVGPRWSYDDATRKNKRAGFDAVNSLRIETDRLEHAGLYIDAALSAGATEVSEVAFSAPNSDGARRQALTQAVAAARADADAIARAGGGSIGELISLSTEPNNAQLGVALEEVVVSSALSRTAGAGTDVTPGQIRIGATVLGHWQFLPGLAPR